MTGEKKQLSKMCLTGFIFSVLPAALGLVLSILALNAYDNLDVTLAYVFVMAILPIVMCVFSIVGLSLSIAGVVTAKRDGKKGRGLGIAGIVLPVIYTVAAVVALCIFMGSCINNSKQKAAARETSDIYKMGSAWGNVDPHYDVSQYRIPEGYQLDLDVSVSKLQLEMYAESRLDTITKSDDSYIKGTRGDYTFLIIRRDRYNEWDESEYYGSVTYWTYGYAQIYYETPWELLAYKPQYLDMYKDPSERFIIITNCGDTKMITEFFEEVT